MEVNENNPFGKALYIKTWEYDGELPDYYSRVPFFPNKTLFNITDNNEDPFFRIIRGLNQNHSNNDYRKIGQLLTNRNIEDLTVIELTVALSSLGYSTRGTRAELVQRLQNHLDNIQ